MILIDTSVWVSFLSSADSNHEKAEKLFEGLNTDEIIIFDYTYTESMTVFRNKIADSHCEYFMAFLNELELNLHFTDHVITRLATEYFFQFKKLSFTDCLILASAKINDYKIATFDEDLKNASKLTLAQ